MLIGTIARLSGLSKDGVRHYESLGLIHASTVRAGSRLYKDYDERTLERLSLIALGKQLHFSLREMADFLNRLMRDEISREERAEILMQKVAEIDARMEDLRRARDELILLAGSPDKDVVDGRLRDMGLMLEK